MDYKQRIKNLLINDKEKLKYTNKNKTSISLVEILEEEMINFKYEDTNDITYIFDLFEVLGEMLDNKGLKQQLSTRFTYIHNVIRNHLHAEPNKEDKQQISRYRMLKNIINKMRDKEKQTKTEEKLSKFKIEGDDVWNRLEIQNEELVIVMQQLKPKEYFIVVGYVLRRKTFKELAQETKLTERTVASIYYRSIKKLRTKMENVK